MALNKIKFNFKERSNNLPKRDLIKKGEGKLTYVQIFGFVLIIFGIIYFASFLLPSGVIDIFKSLKLEEHPDHNEVPIAFFTVMLGVAFSFPDMLKGQTKDISTMRIIVFMFANVICMLLLKMGWGKDSLSEIGLDGYWMGVIALLFGAKATQSYFENANKLISQTQSNPLSTDKKELGISKIAIAQLAKVQNEVKLQTRYPNIISASDTLLGDESCLILYLEDDNRKNIPEYVTVEINENTKIQVKTEIISNSPAGVPHIGQATDELSDSDNPNGFASFCALLTNTDNPDLRFLATAGHNFTEGNFKSMGGYVYGDEQRDVLINNKPKGTLFYQRMHFTQDLAIVKLTQKKGLLKDYISFEKGYKELTINDVKTQSPNVTIASRINTERKGSNIRDVFVLDIDAPADIMYNGDLKRFQNVILLGDTNEREKSNEVSMRGDSGSCVYCNKTKRLIGILIGGNGKFSFVLPIKDVLEINNFKLI